MNLCDVVTAIVSTPKIGLTDADIEATILFLTEDHVLEIKTLRRLVKKLNKILKDEELYFKKTWLTMDR